MEYLKLKDVADIYLGLTHTPKYVDSGIPFLSVKDISGGNIDFSNCHYITEEEYNTLPKGAKPECGDMLFCRVGTIGKPIIIEENVPKFGSFVSLGFLRRKNNEILLNYLKYWMNSNLFYKQVKQNVKGVAQINLNTAWLKEFNIPNVSLKEQKNIVDKLSKVDKMICIKKNEIEKLNQLIKSQFVEMFVNKEYSKITVEDVCEKMKIGPFGSALHKNEISTSGDVFVLGTDNAVDNEFKVYEQRFITTEKFKELEKYKVAAGDIIISMMGTIGRTSVIPVDFYPSIISSHLCMLTSYPNKMDPYFLNCILILDDNISHQININKKGAIMSGLNLGIIKKLQIPNVPIEEQKKFLNIKNQIDKQKFEFEKSLKKLEELQASLMQEYFG